MKLSYSQYRTYLQCPRLYYHQVNNIPSPVKSSSYFSLYGKLIESFFKKYTNIYTKQGVILSEEKIREILKNLWGYIIENNYVDWSEPWVFESSEQIFENVYSDILLNIGKFNFWRAAKSEVSYEVLLKKSQDILSCRMDFIVNNEDGTVEILDGKGTNKMDKNVDVEQLFFYALMYLLKNRKLPNKLGFLYYKYQLIKYIDFDINTIIDFKDKLVLTKKAIKNSNTFSAQVALSKHCRWCVYKYNCDSYITKKNANAEKRDKKINFEALGELITPTA